MQHSKKFKFVLDRFEDKKAVLTYHEQELVVDKEDLGDVSEGDALIAIFTKSDVETSELKDMAKEVLNELLDTDAT